MNTLCLKSGTLFEKENFHPFTLPFQREFPLSHPSFPKRIATLSPSLSKENFHPPTLLFQRELPLSHPSFPITQSQWEKISTTNTVLSKKKQNLKQSWLNTHNSQPPKPPPPPHPPPLPCFLPYPPPPPHWPNAACSFNLNFILPPLTNLLCCHVNIFNNRRQGIGC